LHQIFQHQNQIETNAMTPDVTMTHGTAIATSQFHCHVARHQLDM